jgi:hypothetical protein
VQNELRQHLHVGIHLGVPSTHAGHAEASQPFDEPPLPEPLDEAGMHDPFTHVPLAIVQSVHIPPPIPQAVSTPVWHAPVPSQQPPAHDDALQVLARPPLVLNPPVLPLPLVLDPLALVVPPLLVLDPLMPVLPPLLVPALVLPSLPVSSPRPLLDPEEPSLVSDSCPPLSVRFVQSPIPSTVEHPPIHHTVRRYAVPTAAVAIRLRERGLISRDLLRTSL